MSWYYVRRRYVPVAVRRARAAKKLAKLRRKGLAVRPVALEGRKIARTFWGEAWCEHLEKFSDYANRLPRGRSYVRNGSVCHLEIAGGAVRAMVIGTKIYNVEITIKRMPKNKWRRVRDRCAGQIGSLLELLQGRLSKSVMAVVTDRDKGLFPSPREIKLRCDCPDWAVMCKHVAAVLYGVGARLDESPELLFLLRGVNHEELIGAGAGAMAEAAAGRKGGRRRISERDLADVFGIEMTEEKAEPAVARSKKKRRAGRAASADRPVTGSDVARLRAKLKMSRSRFARLLGVSVPTIVNWEKKKKGRLNLHARTRAAWSAVAGIGVKEARERLDKRH